MKEFFKGLFGYHHHYNQKMADLFLEHQEHLTERTLPLFSHCLNAHQIWNARILNTSTLGVHEEHSLQKFKSLDRTNYLTTLKIIDTFEFDTIINYVNSRGESFSNSVRDILFHAANHHTHHRGQLMSDLRQKGIEPLITDYIFYKR